MKNFSFAPYDQGKGKGICPRCGKKTLSLFIDTESHTLLPSHFGVCDRSNKCNYFNYPSVQNRITEYAIEEKAQFQPKIPSQDYKQKQHCFIEYWNETAKNPPCTFQNYLLSLFGVTILNQIKERYRITSTNDGGTIFWQIDKEGYFRSGKIMYYDTSGKNTGRIDWVHSRLIRQNKVPNAFKLNQCLFGEHLLAEVPNENKQVQLFEGQSTAIYMAARAIQHNDDSIISLATGGKSGTSLANIAKGLEGRIVTLFPDAGYFTEWSRLANRLYRFNVIANVSTTLENLYHENQVEKNDDLRDYYKSQKC